MSRFDSAPRITVILLSTNDAQLEFRRPDEVKEYLYIIIDEVIKRGSCEVVLMTPPQYSRQPGLVVIQNLLVKYSIMIREICEEDDRVECGPDLQVLITTDLLADGSHMNPEGHSIVATELLPLLR